jgi:ankyrin repeat protein
MLKISHLGSFNTVPSEAAHIIDGDINALKNDIENGLDINKPIALSESIRVTLLELAFRTNKAEIVKLLIASGANLNDKTSPAFLCAVRYCNEEIVRLIAKNGADIHAFNNVKSDAFSEALYGKKYKNLPAIEALGHSVRQYGGKAFRFAARNRMYGVLDFFVKNGVDINYNKADQVFPNKPTPLCVAPDLKTAKYLVENGADFMLADGDGMRPHNLAIERGAQDMADYYRSLEPPQSHNMQNRLLELAKYDLPQNLIDFLLSENRRVKINGTSRYCPSYIDFFALADAPEINIGRQTVPRLSREIDNYDIFFIIWNPKTKRIAAYDDEHKELIDIAPFDEFMQNISAYINKLIEGDPI